MTSKRLFETLLAGGTLMAATGMAQAQLLGGADLGATAPTPGYYDISQLQTTGDTIQLQDGAINYFYDNTSGGTGEVGSSFTTGPDNGDYVMNSLSLKFGGGQPVGYAGGADTTLDPGWTITIFRLSGTGNTTATPVYTNTVGALSGTSNSGADWVEITGFNLTLLPNTAYAWTILSSGYDDLAYATGKPYKNGAICRIPPNGGTVTYFPADNDSATFNIGLSQIPPTLGGVDLGGTTPGAGPNDIAQLLATESNPLPDGNLNNFYDNTSATGNGGGGYVGSSYTTGPNPGGYVMSGMVLKFGGTAAGGYAGGNDTTLNGGWIITTYQLSGAGNTVATPIVTNVVGALSGSGNTGGDWIQFTGFDLPLQGNTTYAWTIFQPSGYDDLGYSTGDPYTGGAICRIPPGGGTVKYFNADGDSAAFEINLSLKGFPTAGIPTASLNPIYALSPSLVVADTASGPGTLTYQWQTDGGSGGALTNIPGATGLTFTNIPANLNPGGGDYIVNYDFVVANSAGSVTSSVVAVTVHAATAPIITQDTSPTNSVVSYVGGSETFSAAFDGTQPITYQWYANTNGSNLAIPGQTNASFTLTHIQATAAGTYQLMAHNSQGNTFSTATTLATLTAPPDYPPVPADKYAYEIYTNSPVAYWRLNETANPATSLTPVQAFDYSGNGLELTYGTYVTTSNAGPQAPVFPGFETTNLAAVTSSGNYLTAPPLNLNTNTVTFVCWINPNGAQVASAGLLFARGGPESAVGFGFNAVNNGTGTMPELGYTWNNNGSTTWGWNSYLYPIANQWNLVAYVVTPTNETTYLGYVDTNAMVTNFSLAVNPIAHQVETMNGPTVALGADIQQGREFNGTIDEAALFNRALSQDEIFKLFQVGFGVAAIPPSPVAITSQSVYGGATVTLGGSAGGSQTITYQWQASGTGLNTFTNLANTGNYSGATSPTLTITNITAANALDYQQICRNSAGTVTGNVATVSVIAVPSGGLWTVNFELTNNVLNFTASTNGLGHYNGPGILPGGNFWNPIPDLAGASTAGNYISASDLEADGVTHSGIYCSVNGGAFSSATSPGSAASIHTLLDQYVNVYTGVGGLILQGVPDGTYNLAIYGIDGGFRNQGVNLTVHAANGDQSATLANHQDGYFSQGDNSYLFTDVQIAGGTLLTDVGDYLNEAEFNGLQLQLVAYAPGESLTVLTNSYSSASQSMTLSWSQGTLQTAASLLGPWTSVTVAPPFTFTASTTGTNQFFRLKLQ